jgi:hypothetical protein
MVNLFLQVTQDPVVQQAVQEKFQGGNVAVSGIVTVFTGLILIALLIALFNLVFAHGPGKKGKPDIPGESVQVPAASVEKGIIVQDEVDSDILAAIGATIELYKRLHMDELQSKITFRQGREQTAWKSGMKYGHRA